MRENGRTAFAAPQDAGVGEVADHAANAGMMPPLACPRAVALLVQISSNALCAEAFMNVFIENDTDNSSFAFIDHQIIKFVLTLVEASAFHKIIAKRGDTALETAALDKLTKRGFCADGGLFAFTVRLPEANVVGQLVGMAVETLFALLGAPHLDPILYKPFHHKGRFVRDTSDTVEHEHKQNIELFLLRHTLDDLQLVAVFSSYLMTGHAFFLFLVNDLPAHFFAKRMAGFALHGNIGLVFGFRKDGGNFISAYFKLNGIWGRHIAVNLLE